MHYHVKKEIKCEIKNKAIKILSGIIVITSVIHCSPYVERCHGDFVDVGEIVKEYIVDNPTKEMPLEVGYLKDTVTIPSISFINDSDEISNDYDDSVIPETIIEPQTISYELTNDEKINTILQVHNLTEFEFFEIVSTLAHEAGPNNYQECYDVICTMYNRTLSTSCCSFCAYYGLDGKRIINQIKCPGQFAGYLPGVAGYDKDLYIDTPAYQAAIDFLYTLERSHNYLSFNAPWYPDCPSNAVQLNPDVAGNKYFSLLQESDLNDLAIDLGVNLGASR